MACVAAGLAGGHTATYPAIYSLQSKSAIFRVLLRFSPIFRAFPLFTALFRVLLLFTVPGKRPSQFLAVFLLEWWSGNVLNR